MRDFTKIYFHLNSSAVYISGLNVSELYLGCYMDSTDRDINDAETTSEIMMTTIRCMAFCQGLGYTIAATQVTKQPTSLYIYCQFNWGRGVLNLFDSQENAIM